MKMRLNLRSVWRVVAGGWCLLWPGMISLTAASELSEDQLLQRMVERRDADAALELAQRGASAAASLIQGLQADERTAALCAWGLSHYPVPETAVALRERLGDANQVAGYYAARALGQMPSPENVAALAALLATQENGYWELSSGGVGRLRDTWNAKSQRYQEPAPEGMANLRVAYAGLEALGQLAGDPAAAVLQQALESDQYLIRYGAARGLGRMQHQPSAGRLAALADHDPVLIVRQAARQALDAMQGTLDPQWALRVSPAWNSDHHATPGASPSDPPLPAAVAFIKTRCRSEATLGFRDSYFFPKTPRYHSGENLYVLNPPGPGGELRNLTNLEDGEVQGLEVSFDGTRLLFAMRRNREQDGFHIFEVHADGTNLRQLTDGNCNDVDPCYLPDGRIAFCSDRCGWQEYYHQERSRVLYVMQADGGDLQQITFNPNQDYEPLVLRDGRLSYSSYRFYAQDGSEGPLPGERMGLARIETVLRTCNPDGSGDRLLYGSMRGAFYTPMRPLPFGDQFSGWHGRGYHVGVSASQQREMPDGRIICTTPAGLTLVDPRLAPLDCEMPIYPEVVNLAGGEEVYIHNYDAMNPVGRYTTAYPIGGDWVLVAHAPWYDLRVNGYGLYALNTATRELRLIYDDPQLSEVDPVPLAAQPLPRQRAPIIKPERATGVVVCNSVFHTDQPYDTSAVRYVRVLEGVQMGQSIAANAAFRTRVLGVSPIHEDGSFAVEVPADVPLRFELLDADGRMLIHETEFQQVRPGEIRGCVGCHENRWEISPNAHPRALAFPPVPTLRHEGDLIYFGRPERPYNRVYRP